MANRNGLEDDGQLGAQRRLSQDNAIFYDFGRSRILGVGLAHGAGVRRRTSAARLL